MLFGYLDTSFVEMQDKAAYNKPLWSGPFLNPEHCGSLSAPDYPFFCICLTFSLGCKFQVVPIPGETFIPTSLAAASLSNQLWMVMGASTLCTSDSAPLARVKVLDGFCESNQDSVEQEARVLEDKDLPGSEQLLQTLQGSSFIEKDALSTAAEAVKTAMCNLLIKKQYPSENREFRKRGRNDKRVDKKK